jgi:hypothetical protein
MFMGIVEFSASGKTSRMHPITQTHEQKTIDASAKTDSYWLIAPDYFRHPCRCRAER